MEPPVESYEASFISQRNRSCPFGAPRWMKIVLAISVAVRGTPGDDLSPMLKRQGQGLSL
jgi:hypothetical protein